MRVNVLARFATIPLAFAAGGIAERLLLAHAPARIAIDLAQPYPIVTGWGAFGAAAFAILAATIAIAALALVAGARDPAARATVRATDVIALAAVSLAAALAWPVGFSSDVYAYAAYGAMLAAGRNPYVPLAASAHGAFFSAARRQWSGAFPACVYGPAAVVLDWLAVRSAGWRGVAATLELLRGATALAFLTGIVLLDRLSATRPLSERATALLAYGLNPVVLWSVAEGHNDAWLMLAAFGALALERRFRTAGAFAFGFAAVVKASGAALVAATLLDRGGSRSRAERLASLAGLLCAGVATVALVLPAVMGIGRHGSAATTSLAGIAGPLPALAVGAGLAVYGALQLRAARRDGYAWLGLAIVAALPNGYPWYAVWLVPFALAAGRGRTSACLWAATICAVARYLPDATGTENSTVLTLVAAVAALPVLVALGSLGVAAFPQKVSARR